jgi:hypothetical protein
LKMCAVCISEQLVPIYWTTWHHIRNIMVPVHGTHVPSVHCAGLSDVRGACQHVISGLTAGFPDRLKVIHSVITWSVSQSVLHHQVLQKLLYIVLCAVSLWLMWDTIYSKQFSFMIVIWKKKRIQIMQEKISP